MVIIDFAILQAEIHYNLANSNGIYKRHRVRWYKMLANELIDTDWDKIIRTCKSRNVALSKAGMSGKEDEHYNDESVLKNIGGFLTPLSTNETKVNECVPIASHNFYSSVDGRCCQICRFEGRGRKLCDVNYCVKHHIRCCSTNHMDHTLNNEIKMTPKYESVPCTDWSWICQNKDWTCWEKFHRYYHDIGLFRQPHSTTGRYMSVFLNQSHKDVIRRKHIIKEHTQWSSVPIQNNIDQFDGNVGSTDIIKGKMTIMDDLGNDTSKQNYTNITQNEMSKKQRHEMSKKVREEELKQHGDNDISTNVETQKNTESIFSLFARFDVD